MSRDVVLEYEARGGGLATTGPRRQNMLLAGCLMESSVAASRFGVSLVSQHGVAFYHVIKSTFVSPSLLFWTKLTELHFYLLRTRYLLVAFLALVQALRALCTPFGPQ